VTHLTGSKGISSDAKDLKDSYTGKSDTRILGGGTKRLRSSMGETFLAREKQNFVRDLKITGEREGPVKLRSSGNHRGGHPRRGRRGGEIFHDQFTFDREKERGLGKRKKRRRSEQGH